MLDDTAVRAGYRLIIFDTLGSTNDEALSCARKGDAGKLWITAGSQTRGRGRVGRPWSSPAGNLYASLLLVDPAEARFAPELGFVAGLALARAVGRVAGVSGSVHIKWPNDLVHGGAKFAGVLVEATQLPGGAFACVLGFGVNCRSHPSGLDYQSTHIGSFSSVRPSPAELFKVLSSHAVKTLALWDRGRNFAAVREAWLAMALPRGSPLTVKTPLSRKHGRFETIDDRGRLVLSTPSGSIIVDAADVFLTGHDGSAAAEQGESNE